MFPAATERHVKQDGGGDQDGDQSSHEGEIVDGTENERDEAITANRIDYRSPARMRQYRIAGDLPLSKPLRIPDASGFQAALFVLDVQTPQILAADPHHERAAMLVRRDMANCGLNINQIRRFSQFGDNKIAVGQPPNEERKSLDRDIEELH